MSTSVPFTPPFQRDLPPEFLEPLYQTMKPAIRQASIALAMGVDARTLVGPTCPINVQIEASALAVALAIGNLMSSSYATTREVMGRERAYDWLMTTIEWFLKLQEKNEVNLNVRIIERE